MRAKQKSIFYFGIFSGACIFSAPALIYNRPLMPAFAQDEDLSIGANYQAVNNPSLALQDSSDH